MPKLQTKFAEILSSLEDLVFIMSEDGRYLEIGGSAEATLFLPREQLLGRRMRDVLGEEAARPFEELIQKSLAENAPQTLEYSGAPFNDRFFRGRITPVETRPGESPLITFAIQDITESKQLEENLRVARAAQINAAKLASLGEMAGGVAHEINNPLTIIQTKTQQLLTQLERENSLSPKVRADLEKIGETCDRIARIVKGLTHFARNGEKDPFLPVEVRAILDDVLALCREKFHNHGIKLTVQAAPSLVCECRSIQIAQVLLNLLNNSFDAVRDLADPWIEIRLEDRGSQVTISVIDSGPEIPEAIRPRLMEPFFTTKEVGSGTGLGLSISKGILEQHGGRLTLEASAPHTTFVMWLPKRATPKAGQKNTLFHFET